jgi:type III secretion protein D
MYELRVLSGLHRGATLPLDDHPHVIGASEDADVVLVDTGIEEKHATLTLTDSGWLLTTLEGGLCTADSNQRQTLIDLAPGEFARVGTVWLTVVKHDARWENPPPEPVDDHYDAVGAETSAAPQSEQPAYAAEAAPQIDHATNAAYAAEADDTAGSGDAPARSSRRSSRAAQGPQEPAPFWRRLIGRRVVYIPLSAMVLSAAAAYAITSKPSQVFAPGRAEQHISRAHVPSSDDSGERAVADAYKEVNPDAADNRPLAPSELRKAFRKRLADTDLLNRFDLDLQDNQWKMQAALDEEEAARFERILASFIKQHRITFPVQANVGSSEAMLPFKIRQVISGPNASVVTQDGSRLYVGDTYKGARLMAINGNKLLFDGKHKVEVAW